MRGTIIVWLNSIMKSKLKNNRDYFHNLINFSNNQLDNAVIWIYFFFENLTVVQVTFLSHWQKTFYTIKYHM